VITLLYDNGKFERIIGDLPLLSDGDLLQLGDGVHKVIHRRIIETAEGWRQAIDVGTSTQRPLPVPRSS
jgi:hypothetical protein